MSALKGAELQQLNISYRGCFSTGRGGDGAPSSSSHRGSGLVLSCEFGSHWTFLYYQILGFTSYFQSTSSEPGSLRGEEGERRLVVVEEDVDGVNVHAPALAHTGDGLPEAGSPDCGHQILPLVPPHLEHRREELRARHFPR